MVNKQVGFGCHGLSEACPCSSTIQKNRPINPPDRKQRCGMHPPLLRNTSSATLRLVAPHCLQPVIRVDGAALARRERASKIGNEGKYR
jgi:hypothetical protein